MSVKDIYVHVDASSTSGARLDAAINLAKQHDALLTGVYALTRQIIPAYAEVQISADVMEAQAKALEEAANKVHEGFKKATAAQGLTAAWHCIEGNLDRVLTHEARTADIMVLGQHNPDDDLFPGSRDMPDHVIMSAGRPILMIPYTYQNKTIGKRVMIAWDGGPRATRAVHDALPILKKADRVTVMVANPEGENRLGSEPGAGITAHLTRHGINVEAEHVINKDMSPGELLLNQAADTRADLIVCGAYGHARWKELILGGVTDHLLEHMPVPILMSH